MQIIGHEKKKVKVSEIEVGQCFTYNHELFMRMAGSVDTSFYNEHVVKPGYIASIRLGTGHPATFRPDSTVESVSAKVVCE